jgi:hypothetical protein
MNLKKEVSVNEMFRVEFNHNRSKFGNAVAEFTA